MTQIRQNNRLSGLDVQNGCLFMLKDQLFFSFTNLIISVNSNSNKGTYGKTKLQTKITSNSSRFFGY